jgi:hypothetical protein
MLQPGPFPHSGERQKSGPDGPMSFARRTVFIGRKESRARVTGECIGRPEPTWIADLYEQFRCSQRPESAEHRQIGSGLLEYARDLLARVPHIA